MTKVTYTKPRLKDRKDNLARSAAEASLQRGYVQKVSRRPPMPARPPHEG